MLLNEHTALATSHILLVPYSEHHVPTYHEWMQDEDLQILTASEPLTLPEEYAMQRSWRSDADKLTFIACLPAARSASILATYDDAPTRMIGDINLFLTDSDDDDIASESETPQARQVVGEIEIMIASRAHHRQGYGRAALLAFLWYVLDHQRAILGEYGSTPTTGGAAPPVLSYLRVKIGQENAKSIALFESIGFEGTGAGPNYFGEVELRFGVDGEAAKRIAMVKGFEEEVKIAEYEFN